MIRNLSMDILAVSIIVFGLFQFIPNYILLLIIIGFIGDDLALYFSASSTNGIYFYKRNPDLKKYVDAYLSYTKPPDNSINTWFFFTDRFLFPILFMAIYSVYLYYKI
jgi:hypothetical protein